MTIVPNGVLIRRAATTPGVTQRELDDRLGTVYTLMFLSPVAVLFLFGVMKLDARVSYCECACAPMPFKQGNDGCFCYEPDGFWHETKIVKTKAPPGAHQSNRECANVMQRRPDR